MGKRLTASRVKYESSLKLIYQWIHVADDNLRRPVYLGTCNRDPGTAASTRYICPRKNNARTIGESLASIITCNQRGSFIRLSTIVPRGTQNQARRGRPSLWSRRNRARKERQRRTTGRDGKNIPLVYSSLHLRNLFIEDVAFKHRPSSDSSGDRRESKAAGFVGDLFARKKSIGKNFAFLAQIHELPVTAAATTQRWMWPTWRRFMTVYLVGPKDPRQGNDFYITLILAVPDFLYCCNLRPL